MNAELWKMILYPVLAMLGFGIGWFGKDWQLNGVVGATEPLMVGGMSVTGIVMMFFGMYTAWKVHGGKIDGKLTETDISAAVEAILEKIDPTLDDKLAPIIDKLAALVLPVADKAVGPTAGKINSLIPGGAVTATRLLDWIETWYKDDKETANESALLNTFLDKLSEMVKDDEEGKNAAATLRARLHAVLNTVKSPTEVKVA